MTDKPGYRRPQEGTQPEYLHPAYQSTNRRPAAKRCRSYPTPIRMSLPSTKLSPQKRRRRR